MASLADVFVAVTGDLGPLRQAAQEGGAEAGQTAAAGFRGKFEAGIKIAAAAAGALMVAGLAGAISRGNTTALLSAQVGAAGPEMAKLGKVSGELYAAGYGESVEAVNDALKAVLTNGLAGVSSSEADIKAVASRVSDLTALMGEDAGRVSAAIQQMLRTGMAKSAEEAFDLLTKATQGGINKSEDLLDTLNEYGVQFQKLGLDGPEAMGLISQAIKAGARDSDTAADALKEFSLIGVSGSTASAEAFTKLGINAGQAAADIAAGGDRSQAALGLTLDKLREMPPSVERTQLAVALFGTKAEDLGNALFAMDTSKAVTEFGNFEGAAQKAGDTLAGSAGAKVETFKRQIEEGLVNAMAKAIPTLQSMADFIQRNADVIGPLAAVVGGFAVAVWAVNAAMTAYAVVQTIATALASTWLFRTVLINVQLAAYFAWMGLVRLATIAWTGIQWLLNAALTANPIGLVVVGIALLVAAIILAWKHSETFRNIVMAVWGAIKVAIGAVVDWFTGVIWPSLKKAYDDISAAVGFVINAVIAYWKFMLAVLDAVWAAVKAVFKAGVDYVVGQWNTWKSIIEAGWTFVRDKVFNPLKTFITETIPDAFRRGVEFIGTAWDRLKEVAKIPVRFVIDTIINKGIIDTFNAVAGFLHLPDSIKLNHVNPPAGFAAGGYFDGRLPGPPSDVDNMLARGPGGRPIALAGGEMVVNARQTAKHLPTLMAINSGLDGYAAGGVIGLITDPIGWVKDHVNLGGIPGGGIFRSILTGVGGRMVDGLIEWVKSQLFSSTSIVGLTGGPGFGTWPSSPSAQRGDSGVWRTIVALINSTGPISGSFGNAYRAGDPLWHGSGRAVDWMGFNQDSLATFLSLLRPLELIHRTNKRDYAYTRGINKGSFNNTLMEEHRNHVHIAMSTGGLLPKVFDRGGAWPSGTLGINTSGRTEVVSSAPSMDKVIDLLRELITAVHDVAPGVGAEMTGAARGLVQMGRTR